MWRVADDQRRATGLVRTIMRLAAGLAAVTLVFAARAEGPEMSGDSNELARVLARFGEASIGAGRIWVSGSEAVSITLYPRQWDCRALESEGDLEAPSASTLLSNRKTWVMVPPGVREDELARRVLAQSSITLVDVHPNLNDELCSINRLQGLQVLEAPNAQNAGTRRVGCKEVSKYIPRVFEKRALDEMTRYVETAPPWAAFREMCASWRFRAGQDAGR